MPTYDYGCEACGHEFEKEQRITEDPIKKCPECGKNKARRLITQANFILKGGGWYSDLYSGPSNKKSNGTSSTNGSDTTSTPADSSSTSSASDSKPKGSEPKGSEPKGSEPKSSKSKSGKPKSGKPKSGKSD